MAFHSEYFPNEGESLRRFESHARRRTNCNLHRSQRRDVLFPTPPSTCSSTEQLNRGRRRGFSRPLSKRTQPNPERSPEHARTSGWILVIDDVPAIRSVLNRLLHRRGYNVVVAPNLDVALRDFGSLPVRVLILDLIIPGYELTSSFSNTLKCFPKADAIAMSGGGRCGSESLLSVALTLGAAATLPKPFATRQLLDLVERLWAI